MVKVKKRILVSATLAVLVGVLPCVAQDVFSSISQEVQTVFENSKGAVARIRGDDRHGRCVGSGFFIDPNGTLYTAYAVGGESDNITVEVGDRKYPATRLVADQRSGIAILKIEGSTPFLPIGSSRNLNVASPVVAIGYPMDLGVSPSFGMVGGFDLKYLNRYFGTTHIRANVPVQRGEGGAPLLNTQGQVVGILVSGLDNGAACFVLPIEAAEKIREDYVRYGEVRHGFLGITIARNTSIDPAARPRVEVLDVDGPAVDAGLKKGDFVVKVGQIQMRQPEDFVDASFFLTAGESVPVEIFRNNELQTINVIAVDHPASEKNRPSPFQRLTMEPAGESLRLNGSN
ncbi:MAG TPA: S1C family serine protease [Chthoniobacterales bacterium]